MLNKSKIPAIALVVLVPKYGIVGAALSTTIACFVGLILLIIVYDHYTSTSNIIKTIVAFAVFGFFIYLFPHSSRV